MKYSSHSTKRILIVEDEPAISEVCLRVLTSERLETSVAANGKVAQNMLDKEDYDLCLIDIRTPVMDGKQLFQYILGNHPTLVRGVIFMTGDMADGYTHRFLELTGRPFLQKPFVPGELQTIVRETLKQMEAQ